jgi:predicted lactoylglutathione lyase
MTKDLWINLPVKDVKKSKDFFTKLGFSFDTKYGNTEHSAGMTVGSKKIVFMLFAESMFKGFINNSVTDSKQSNEVLFSFDAESRAEVDEMAKKVTAAGGTLYAKPAENQGWMYGFAFIDPDGHRWNMLYMDMSKMPQG